MQQAYGEFAVDGEEGPVATDEMRAQVTEGAAGFITVFDEVCHKHDVKRTHRPGSDLEFPKKLRLLQQTVRRCSEKYHREIDCKGTPNESTCIRLACAQKHFKKEKKVWQVRMRQKFYAGVADDFIANDTKRVWSKLRAQVKPSSVVDAVNPVKDKDGVVQFHADRIL